MSDNPAESAAPRWRPLERIERRVAGVLAEKAKTTPDSYPLTPNSLVNGCNQKSNRFPLMQLDEAAVDQALDGLRRAGAVSLVQGDGRVEKYRHLLYDWLGVNKAELAVMTELLLRGAQTVGELRGRAARMEPISDIGQLMPIVDSLKQKGLLIYLSPPGRGAVVTHNLYQPQELAKVKAEHAGGHASTASEDESSASGAVAPPRTEEPSSAPARPVAPRPQPNHEESAWKAELAALRAEVSELREGSAEQIESLRQELADLKRQLGA